jgi:hypothetical protein
MSVNAMLRTPKRLFICVILSWGAMAGVAQAGDTMAATRELVRERVLRLTEYFDTMLPGTLEEHNMTLHFTPKFSDFRDHEFVRYPLELRYGATQNWELSGGLTPFGPNPINGGQDHRWGPGEGKLATRYDLGHLVPCFDDTTIGVETRVPLGKPPIDLNDHYTHVKPFVSLARTLRIWPDTTLYSNLSYDRSIKLTPREAPPPEVMRRNIIELAPGLLFKPSEMGYFAEYHFRHIAEARDNHLGHEVEFGTIWDVPLARTERWNLPGKWQLEFAYKVSHEEGLGMNQGFAARVNWRTTLREVLTKTMARAPDFLK